MHIGHKAEGGGGGGTDTPATTYVSTSTSTAAGWVATAAALEGQVARWEAREGLCLLAQPGAVMLGALQVVREASVGPAERRAGQVVQRAARGRGSIRHTRSRGGEESRRSPAVRHQSAMRSRSK